MSLNLKEATKLDLFVKQWPFGHDYKNLSVRFACTCVIQRGVFVIKWNYESYLSQNNSLSISNSIPMKNKHSW